MPLPRGRPFLVTSLLALLAAGCGGASAEPATVNPTAAHEGISAACDEAMAGAAAVDDMADTVTDLDPAIRVCLTLDEWALASGFYPAALDGADPVEFAVNRCDDRQAGLGRTPLCASLGVSASCYLSMEPDLLDSALSVCQTLDEWTRAAALRPEALGGADPKALAQRRCADKRADLRRTAICKSLR